MEDKKVVQLHPNADQSQEAAPPQQPDPTAPSTMGNAILDNFVESFFADKPKKQANVKHQKEYVRDAFASGFNLALTMASRAVIDIAAAMQREITPDQIESFKQQRAAVAAAQSQNNEDADSGSQ